MAKENTENTENTEEGGGESTVASTVASKPEALKSGTMVMTDSGDELPVVTREEAIAAGSNRYFTGYACQNGHMTERKVKGYVCVTCARNRAKARRKARIASDPEYKAKLAKARADKHKARYAEDPEYRQRVLDRAKARRAKASAEKAQAKAEAQIKEQANAKVEDTPVDA